MRDFDYLQFKDRTWDNEILSLIAKIHEFKATLKLYENQKPVELEKLVQIAKIQSTEASNKIEGIATTNIRLRKLFLDKTSPVNRAEEEILGYKNVLSTIHDNYKFIPLNINYILQLHKELLKFTTLEYGGKFKSVENSITKTSENGKTEVLFTPLKPFETENAMKQICDSYNKAIKFEIVDSLILIPCFILDFLCIHPFLDGNGRMSRLLTLLLLYQSDYLIGRYISIEKAISDTKENYYQALSDANKRWHDGKNDPKPFIKYLLSIIFKCYKDFEEKVMIANKVIGVKSSSYDIVKNYASKALGKFSKQDALYACPTLGSSSVEAALKKLTEEKFLLRLGSGRNTLYVRNNKN